MTILPKFHRNFLSESLNSCIILINVFQLGMVTTFMPSFTLMYSSCTEFNCRLWVVNRKMEKVQFEAVVSLGGARGVGLHRTTPYKG